MGRQNLTKKKFEEILERVFTRPQKSDSKETRTSGSHPSDGCNGKQSGSYSAGGLKAFYYEPEGDDSGSYGLSFEFSNIKYFD